jgi:transforming growth factor-beta-induced protein
MKNFIATYRIRRGFHVVLMSAFMLLASSCAKEALTPDIATDPNLRAPAPGMDPIAQVAMDNGFNELVNALVYVDAELGTGFVDLFSTGTDQYTVFAPTDSAFFNLYDAFSVEVVDSLPAEIVRDVLLYHVTEGRRAANSVVPKKNPRTIETLLEDATFSVNSDASIDAIGNTANIILADVTASNGIVHAIDAVLLPL